MKFSVLQQDFLPTLQAVSRSVGVRSTLPVLDNILLSVEGKKLKVAATNLEIGVIKNIAVEALDEGSITIPAKTLLEVVSGLDQGKITLELEGELLTIRSGNFQAQINGISSSEFPAIPVSGKGVSFPKQALLSCAQILFAAAVDEGRPVLTGILTEVKDGVLNLVATDGFRLAHREVEITKDGPASFRSLIPKRTLEEVLRVLDEEEASEVSIAISEGENQIIFTIGPTIVSSRLIEGVFPAWEKIIPEKTVARVVLEREGFLKAIKLAAVFAKNEANIVVVRSKKEGITLMSQAKELGSQQNKIDASVEGEDLEVAFNTRFLIDALSSDNASSVMIEFSGPLSACMIKPVGEKGLEYIIMPVRLT